MYLNIKYFKMEMKSLNWITTTILLIFVPGRGISHEIVELVVPSIADPRETAILSCRFDMAGEQLYSAKWFKDDDEIFRYMPAQKPAGLSFPVSGVQLVRAPQCSALACDLELEHLEPRSGGAYRCEVSNEAPMFKIVQRSSNMTVAALPWKDPLVEGAAAVYSQGEEIRLNCTSDPSLPEAEVTWYINDMQVTQPYVESGRSSAVDARGLSQRSLALRLRADRTRFPGGTARFRCSAQLPGRLPGGPHKRDKAITARLLPAGASSNQMLEWKGNNGKQTCLNPTILVSMAATVLLQMLK